MRRASGAEPGARSGGDTLSASRTRRPARVFTLRIWLFPDEVDEPDPSGRVRDLASGTAREFAGWPGLVEALIGLLRIPPGPGLEDEAGPK